MASFLHFVFLITFFGLAMSFSNLVDLCALPVGYNFFYAGFLIYDGIDSIFYLGGADNESCDILEFNINVEEAPKKISDCLIGYAYGDSVGTDGKGNIFYFAVGNAGENRNNIYANLEKYNQTRVYRFSSKNPELEEVGTVPRAITCASMGSDGAGSIYIYGGGQNHREKLNEVYCYNTTSNTASRVWTLRPHEGGGQIKGTWANGSMYSFSRDRGPAEIFKYTPGGSEGQVASVSYITSKPSNVVLKSTPWFASLFPIEHYIYMPMLPGDGGIEVYIYNTASEILSSVPVRGVPQNFYFGQFVHVPKNNRIYVFGGSGGMNGYDVRSSGGRIAYIQLT